MSLTVWLGFLVAAILIAVSPGPGAAVSMSTGLRYGYASALRVIVGLQGALICQLAIVFCGLGALLATSALAFDLVKYAGALYLCWMGFQKWRSAPEEAAADGVPIVPRGLYWQGMLVNLTNPKAIVFIAALVPQFIDPTRAQWPQFLVIGATLCGVDMIVMSGYALMASRLRRWLHGPRSQRAQNRFFGGVFVSAGLWLGATGRA